MIPILYDSSETSFASNGICRLADATSCIVTEARNGEYELTFAYPITGKYYDQIAEGMYVSATHDDTGDRQAFCIYRRSAPISGLVQFWAHHISYELNNIVLNPTTATSAADAFSQIEQNTVATNPFTMWTDLVAIGTFKTDVPATVRSILGGSQGSILDVYGGEYEWDMRTVKLHAARGVNSGVTIRYGKNLADINQVIDAGGIYNAIVPFWFGTVNEVDTLVTLPEGYVAATGVTNVILAVKDFTSEFDSQPTQAQLRAKATTFLNDNRPWIPNENIKVKFVQLWQTEEYKDVAVLQRLGLCDRVNVYYPALGITAENVEIIKTVYNVLLDRYDEMELGQAKSTFADSLISPVDAAIQTATEGLASKSYTQSAIDRATQMITGGLGGHVVFVYDANDQPTEILIMDTADTSTAVNVLRMNVNGIGFSSNGVNGPFTSAWTLDGQFVADFITAGTMSANRINGGTLTLGGVDNGDGVLTVNNAAGSEVVRLNNAGIKIKKGEIFIPFEAGGGGMDGTTISAETPLKVQITPVGSVNTSTTYIDAAGMLHMEIANNQPLSTDLSEGKLQLYGYYGGITNGTAAAIRLNGAKKGSTSARDLWLHADEIRFWKSGESDTYFTHDKLYVKGSAVFDGTKSRGVSTDDYGKRLLYCYETPSPLFGDVGEGTIADDGKCYVMIDSIFAETVTLTQYQVLLQKYGEGDCWISERTPAYFIVEGTPGLSFGWELKAKQSDFDQLRLEKDMPDMTKASDDDAVDYGGELLEHIEKIKREREVA